MDSIFDDFLFRHVLIEMGSSVNRLLESHGYKDLVSGVVDILYKYISIDIENMKDGDACDFHYSNMSIFNGIDVFFSGYDVNVHVEYNSSYNGSNSIGEYDDNSKLIADGDNVEFHPEINISAKGNNKLEIRNRIAKTLGHELTHAYNDYDVFVGSEYKNRLGDLFLVRYNNKSQNSPNKIEAYIDEIIYFTDRCERNAHIAQLKQEMELYDRYMSDATDLYRLITMTETYKKLNRVIDDLSAIKKIVSDDQTGISRKDLVDVVNSLTGKEFKRFRPAFEFIRRRVLRAKMKFDEQAPKIAYDVYLNRKSKFT